MAGGVLGVLGGMGALASAAFVATIYRRCLAAGDPATVEQAPIEQGQPVVWLRSNPRIPDRTAALLEGRGAALASIVGGELEALLAAGADRLVVCCVTAHAVWPALPEAVRSRTISLLDALFAMPALAERRRLVLCTEATRRLGLFEAHPAFPPFADRLVFPDDAGQRTIHALVYALKHGAPPPTVVPTLVDLAERAGAAGFVAGCTEMHLVGELPAGLDMVDPLIHIADRLDVLLG